jgi:hypothetical protein
VSGDGPVADFELQRVRNRHRAWDITREGLERVVARDGFGREVEARSPAALDVLLNGETPGPGTDGPAYLP